MGKPKAILSKVLDVAMGSAISGPGGAVAGLLGGGNEPRELQRSEKAQAAAAADAPLAEERRVGADADARRVRLAGRRGRAAMVSGLGTPRAGGSGVSVRGGR